MSQERLMQVLLAPHISEKTTLASDRRRQFAFRVLPDATRPEIKQAVELMFKVEVTGVQVLNVKGKHKRVGRMAGRRADWKKAYVTLGPGHDIDFTGGQ
jgi:large subunit ribosomal protein L23